MGVTRFTAHPQAFDYFAWSIQPLQQSSLVAETMG